MGGTWEVSLAELSSAIGREGDSSLSGADALEFFEGEEAPDQMQWWSTFLMIFGGVIGCGCLVLVALACCAASSRQDDESSDSDEASETTKTTASSARYKDEVC